MKRRSLLVTFVIVLGLGVFCYTYFEREEMFEDKVVAGSVLDSASHLRGNIYDSDVDDVLVVECDYPGCHRMDEHHHNAVSGNGASNNSSTNVPTVECDYPGCHRMDAHHHNTVSVNGASNNSSTNAPAVECDYPGCHRTDEHHHVENENSHSSGHHGNRGHHQRHNHH